MAGKFEIYKDARGEYRFRLKASNGQIIAVGEGYKSKSACLNGIESVKTNSVTAVLDDQTASVPEQKPAADSPAKAGADS